MSLLKPKHNYSVISTKSEFIQNIVVNYLVELNTKAGVYQGRSLLGTSVVVSNTDNPNKKTFVISTVERPNFDIINLDEDLSQYLMEILGIENVECRRFIRTNVLNNKSIRPELAYYYMIVLRDTVEGGVFNLTQAEYIVSHYRYKSHSTSMDRYKAFYTFIMNPNEINLFHMVSVLKDMNEPFKNLTSMATQFNDRSVPENVYARLSISYTDPIYLKNVLTFSIALLNSQTYDEFITFLIARISE